MIDLRSDTLTRPTPAMLAAMATAELGDDVLDGDPTTRRLEAVVAERLGHEAALFLPTATQGNLLAALLHCRPGDEVIAERRCHFLHFEQNGIAAVAGCLPLMVDGERGQLSAELVERTRAEQVARGPKPKLVWLENTANLAGGTVLDAAATVAIGAVARAHGMAVHLDGARIFNAAVAAGVEPARLAAPCDTVTVCLSKGLCCPAGALLCGSASRIEEARARRQQLGGAMRQNGVLAAAGLVAVETMITRLAEDHAVARRLAEGLAALPGIELIAGLPETNLVWFRGPDERFAERLAAAGVLVVTAGGGRCRAAAHHDLPEGAAETALECFRSALEAG